MLRFTNVDITPTRLPPVYAFYNHPLLTLREALAPILIRIIGLDQFIRIATAECHFPSEHDLTRDESASIYIYTMEWGEQSLYRKLNAELQNSDRSVLAPWHGYLRLFDTALQKLPSLQAIIWRGINHDISNDYREGVEMTWWKFSSCSTAVSAVKEFLGPISTLLMIEAKNAKSISIYSNSQQEKEVVLPLGTRVRVVSDTLTHSSMNLIHFQELVHERETTLMSPSFSTPTMDRPIQPIFGEHVHFFTTSWITLYSKAKQSRQKLSQLWPTKWKNTQMVASTTWRFHRTVFSTAQPSLARLGGDPIILLNESEGEMKNGKKDGRGTFYSANGQKYVGDWVDDKKTGQGVLTWPSGDRYEGWCSPMGRQYVDASTPLCWDTIDGSHE